MAGKLVGPDAASATGNLRRSGRFFPLAGATERTHAALPLPPAMTGIRRILVACDKFKGSLSAPAACEAIAAGLARRFPGAVIEQCPIADGGEGFAEAMAVPLGGRWVEVPVEDALGRVVVARYLVAPGQDGALAVMEMAAASGLWRIAAAERNILRANTFGTGQMMRHAVEVSGARRLILGIGGSATNDGGAGMAAALGVRLHAADGSALDPWPSGWVGRLAGADRSGVVELPPVTAACDVDNPLLGPRGATRIFGPQKGGDESTLPILEQALAEWVSASRGEEAALRPGAGAAGGLGFGLLHIAGADLVPGFDLLAGLTDLADRVARADLIVTGEGSLDAQTLGGKGPAGLARLAREAGRPAWAFCGRADEAARASGVFDRVLDLASTNLPEAVLMGQAAILLEKVAACG